MTVGADLVVAGLLAAREDITHTDRWNMLPATITDAGVDAVVGRFDGDGFNGTVTSNVPMISLIGYVAQGARVMTITIPPSGVYIIADLSGAESQYNFSDTIDTTTSVAYTTAGAPLVGTAFIVPASGKVSIYWSGELHNTLLSITLVAPQIAEGATVGSGSTVVPASDAHTIRADTAQTVCAANFQLFTVADGLTPGTEYNVTLYHRVFAGTGGITRRSVLVTPVR